MIIEFKQEFIEDVVQMYIDAFAAEPWNEVWKYEWALQRIEWLVAMPQFKGYLKLQNDHVVGAILGYAKPFKGRNDFEIVELFIDPLCQRNGIGKELVSTLEYELKRHGFVTVTLLTAVNTAAERFYQKNGYSKHSQLCFMSHSL